MQDSVTIQVVAAVRIPETTPFCIFFLNSELKENKKNLLKKKIPLKSKQRSEEHPNPYTKKKTHYNYSCAYSLLGEGIYERSVGGVQCR